MGKRDPIFAPAALRRPDAARHVGVSPHYFDRLVEAGTMPAARRLGENVKVWLRQELEDAVSSLPPDGEAAGANPCDRLLR